MTMDMVFEKEFKQMMVQRQSMTHNFNISRLPVPHFKTMVGGLPKGQYALIRGIREPFFERLNKQEVQLVGRTKLYKRQVLSDGTFRKDNNGEYVKDAITVPRGSVAIVSTVSIGLKRFIEVDGVKREHVVSQGFRYVDYVDTKEGRKYIYIVPKDFVYRTNLCALVITKNKRRVFFKGSKIALQNGHYIYLYVIPYKYRENMDLFVLGVKSDFNFDKEVSILLKYWGSRGVIFDPQLTHLDGVESKNLGIELLEGTIASDDYVRFNGSMKDEKEEDLEEMV